MCVYQRVMSARKMVTDLIDNTIGEMTLKPSLVDGSINPAPLGMIEILQIS